MARKKTLTKEEEKTIKQNILNVITKVKKTYEENLDVFEAVNDHLKDIFECNLDCNTCSEEEWKECLQRFKEGNVFWIIKIREMEYMIKNMIDPILYFVDSMQDLFNKLGIKWATDKDGRFEEEDEYEEDEELVFPKKTTKEITKKTPKPKKEKLDFNDMYL